MKGSITVYDRYRRVVGMNDEGIRTRGCKLCLDPRVEKLELAYFNKTMSVDDIVTELDEAIKDDIVKQEIDNKDLDKKQPLEKISKKLEPSLNVVPNKTKAKPDIYTDSFNDDDIKKIKIVSKKKSHLIFFEDADSD